MAISAENISGQQITWVATPQLRYAGKIRFIATLQQLWKNMQTGEQEWRNVEFVSTKNNGDRK
jgi:hypothetical protein